MNRARLFLLIVGLRAWAAEPFAASLYPALEKAQCRLCHNDNGVASATRLQFPPASATEDEINRFGLRLRVLVDRANPDQSPLLRKPTNRMAHSCSSMGRSSWSAPAIGVMSMSIGAGVARRTKGLSVWSGSGWAVIRSRRPGAA